ncbi:MAG TPA: hypothetical protein VFS21_12165 [Roseiflexaceae bacterium]|nr:hypothetical protein [Roseiflexaceae bacterium]
MVPVDICGAGRSAEPQSFPVLYRGGPPPCTILWPEYCYHGTVKEEARSKK